MNEVREASEGADKRNREPIACRLHFAHLPADVPREMRKGVALAEAAFRGDVFVAAGKGNRLEADKGDLLGVFHRKLHDGADLVVVDVVHDGHNEYDLDAGFVHVFDGAELDVKEVADLAVAVGIVTDAVELQVGVAHAGLDRKSTRLNSSHQIISYAVFCLKKKK